MRVNFLQAQNIGLKHLKHGQNSTNIISTVATADALMNIPAYQANRLFHDSVEASVSVCKGAAFSFGEAVREAGFNSTSIVPALTLLMPWVIRQ